MNVENHSISAPATLSNSSPNLSITLKVSQEDIRRIYFAYKRKEIVFAWSLFIPYQDSMAMQSSKEENESVPELRKVLQQQYRQTFFFAQVSWPPFLPFL
jgi:hypothetical protein